MKWSANCDFAAQCALAKKFGYDGIEIAPFTLSADPPRLSQAERRDIRADRRRSWPCDHEPALSPARAVRIVDHESPTPRSGAAPSAVMRELCAFAADLGARVLVHGSPDQRKVAGSADADGRNRGIDCFAAVAEAAAAAGVVYCIEPLSRDQTAFVNTIEEAADIVRQIGSPAVRTMLDCSSAALTETESIPDLIRRWIPSGLIAHVHFNDPNRQRAGRRRPRLRPDPQRLARAGLSRRRRHRALHLRAGRAGLRGTRDWLYPRHFARKLMGNGEADAVFTSSGGTSNATQNARHSLNRPIRHGRGSPCALAGSCSYACARSPRGSARPGGGADLRHHQGRGHRQCLYLPLPEPSVDVHRHARGRDRDRPDQLRASAGGDNLYRRDPGRSPRLRSNT